MPFTIYLTQDFDQMSRVAADLVEADIKGKQAAGKKHVLGLATGNTPTGLYKHLAKAFNAGRIDPYRVRSFNLDEYAGLPGENAQQRVLNCNSYSYFMIAELFGLLQKKFPETHIPAGALIDRVELAAALEKHGDQYELQGNDNGKAVIIKQSATGILKQIKQNILDSYRKKIEALGGIDLHIIGVGARGHVGFHESGIPFEGNDVLLVKLDDDTIEHAVKDGYFPSRQLSPCYAVSMGAELVYKARTVLLVANGKRKTAPVTASVLGNVTCEVPISYGRKYAAEGGNLIYVIDEDAATEVMARQAEIKAKGCKIIDMRSSPYEKVETLAFVRHPETERMG